jgi:hypothetical protein
MQRELGEICRNTNTIASSLQKKIMFAEKEEKGN